MDTATGTDYTEWVEPETFAEKIATFPGDKEEGAEEARKHCNGPGEISFPIDGSRLGSRRTEVSVA